MDEMMEKAMVAAEQKIQAKMDEAMAKRLNAEAPQQLNVNIMQPPQLNNNNNNNSMQMQAPMPQQMYTHESRAKWHSGLLDPFNDMSICASRPDTQHAPDGVPPSGNLGTQRTHSTPSRDSESRHQHRSPPPPTATPPPAPCLV